MKSPSESNVMVLSLARNCGHSLQSDVNRIRKALNCFKDISFHVVESDSTDNTVQCLEAIAAEKNSFSFISLGELSHEIPDRICRICHCRNVSLKKLESRDDIDFVVIADLDGINDEISGDAVLSCWRSGENWDVCTANQSKLYYDIYALRHEFWSNRDCWRIKRNLKPQVYDLNSRILSVDSRMIHLDRNGPLIQVASAFGGFAIYRREVLEGCSYSSLDCDGEIVCEHVMLHEAITNKGFRIFINPALINGGWNEHTRHMMLHYLITYTKPGRFIGRLVSKI